MNKALFLFRFNCKEPAVDYPGLPTFYYRPGIFIHTIERAKELSEKLNCSIHFVCIADNSTPTLIDRCERKMVKLLGNNCTMIRTNCLEDEFNPTIPNHPARKLKNGVITTKWMHTTFTFYVTSMEEIKNKADSETVIFFCESDYLYSDDAFIKGFNMISEYNEDFVTLYEHPGSYNFSVEEIKSANPYYELLFVEKYGHKWRTASSTCLTFLATLKSLNKYPHLFLEGNADWGDSALWHNISNNGNSKLWMPTPSLAYHMFSHNMDSQPWITLQQSMLHKEI